MVLAPEHPLVDKLRSPGQQAVVEDYQKLAAAKRDLDRTELNKKKTGVFTGAYAINPVNNQEIPIWISDYVMMGYGTGAIMAFLPMMNGILNLHKNLSCQLFTVYKPDLKEHPELSKELQRRGSGDSTMSIRTMAYESIVK